MLDDIDHERGVLKVRQGKGKKDRLVPIGDRALAWMNKYVIELRPRLRASQAEPTIYLTRFGRPFAASSLTILVSGYVRHSDVGGQGSCHLFRHAMATAMHDGGADIRFIQAILGHARIDTTQIYTHVSIQKLKEIHRLPHPARSVEPGKTTTIHCPELPPDRYNEDIDL